MDNKRLVPSVAAGKLAAVPAQGHILGAVRESLDAELSELYRRYYVVAEKPDITKKSNG